MLDAVRRRFGASTLWYHPDVDPSTYTSLGLNRMILRGGVGALRFGMSPQDVQQLTGPPEEIADPMEYRGSQTPHWWDALTKWYFDCDESLLRLQFKNVHGRGDCLVSILTDNPAVRLLGNPLIPGGLAKARGTLEALGVRHTDMSRFDGIDSQDFDHGLTLWTFCNDIEQVEWTILDPIACATTRSIGLTRIGSVES